MGSSPSLYQLVHTHCISHLKIHSISSPSSPAGGGTSRGDLEPVAAWRTPWRLGGAEEAENVAEEAEKVVEKAEGDSAACPSWQPRCIS
jgi:hypothetical protein